jgi:acrylyl-CoA reductase (NADPH)
MFDALFLDRSDGTITAQVRSIDAEALPEGDVLVSVAYSSLNYKDALAVTGEGKIIRGDFPFIPGIDLVGTIAASSSPDFRVGDRVIQTGWGLGETHWGGFAQKARLRSKWLVPLPEGLTPEAAMTIGTAGFTAMLSVMALEAHGARPGAGEIAVTGASGGVGSMAVALLSHLGYRVVASTGKESAHAYLAQLGAARIVGREAFSEGAARPLDSAHWAGAVDSVGGDTLAALLSQMDRHASVAACGNAGGHALHTTVFPFILRGVNLLGIDSNTCPNDVRRTAWQRLAATLPEAALDRICAGVIPLREVAARSNDVLRGRVQGRLVVDVNA